MDSNTYQAIADSLLLKASQIENAKRPAYTGGNPDCLHNFKTVAARLGITPLQAWGVYFLKHIDAITSLAKDETLPQAEAIEGRFADAINYLKLGFAVFTEGLGDDYEGFDIEDAKDETVRLKALG